MKKLEMQRKQKGFTIIELVVVILLLGILTATALPRFMDVTDEAHDAAVSGVVGGFSTGAALFRAQWYAENQPNVPSEFGGLVANRAGYPLGIFTITSTRLRSVGEAENCVEIFQNLLQAAGAPTIAARAETSTALASLTTLTTGTYDFVAQLDDSDSATGKVCNYLYTGQFKTNSASVGIPVITYNAGTGSVVVSEI